MTRKAALTDRLADDHGIAVTTTDGVVLDAARRDDSGRIIVGSQRGDNPEAVSITDIRIARHRTVPAPSCECGA
ncbi:MAG: hypothetical protein F4Y08_13255 [Caldilineaceae bacterium SB0662_bin_9]|uniref:Uncharacterized protein n=1 Tax=Caldilineaceae bacterium SB0662_bin_9 TaxID=2605258 RepID=A0A6B1DX43_9CHLR|nr:hypothetical protein [Caldilineaceae bacterium SB0662_bin_9]